ncbi:MAG: TIGR00180 family glycosyltransferase, partial [SAR202 cluster bacterium]|nr:TIGR00180 family glycosyltransferase [SAR202 cluster bacterium]
RPSFIQRTVLYYDSLKSPHPIYIGDASNTEISENTLSFLKKVKNVEVKYFHWEGLNASQTHFQLIKEITAECEYCAYHGDDDYLVPSSLTKCAEFLSENPNYKTAQGHAALVVMDSPEPVGNIKWIDEYWGKNSLEESSRIERLLSFNNNYFGMMFSVHRVSEFIADSNDFLTIIDRNISELSHNYTFAINGKSKFIDCLYLIRTRHPDLLISSSGYDFFESITRKNWFHDYNKMVDSLSRLVSDDKKLSFTEAKKIISEMMKERFKKSFLAQMKINKKDDKQSFYVKSKNVIHGCLTHILLDKIGLRPIREFFGTKNNMQLWTAKHSRFHSDFLPVENSLTGKEIRNDEKLIYKEQPHNHNDHANPPKRR